MVRGAAVDCRGGGGRLDGDTQLRPPSVRVDEQVRARVRLGARVQVSARESDQGRAV